MPYVVPDAVREPLYAVVPYFNPWRWKSREKHTLRAIKHFADAGAVVILVEAAFNRREFSLADCGLDGVLASCHILPSDHNFRHRYIGLRTTDELWLKENLINAGVSRLPDNWQQVCWLDSDVQFARPNWAGECIHKLQHYAFLQMFSHARDLGPNYEMLPEDYPHADGQGFVTAFQNGTLEQYTSNEGHHRHHHHHHPPSYTKAIRILRVFSLALLGPARAKRGTTLAASSIGPFGAAAIITWRGRSSKSPSA